MRSDFSLEIYINCDDSYNSVPPELFLFYVLVWSQIYVLYVCMVITYIKQSMDQPGKVANPARGQLNRENEHSPVPVRA